MLSLRRSSYTTQLVPFWWKNPAPLTQPCRTKTKTHRDPLANFPAFGATYTYFPGGFASLDWFTVLSMSSLIDWNLSFGFPRLNEKLFIFLGKSVNFTFAFFPISARPHLKCIILIRRKEIRVHWEDTFGGSKTAMGKVHRKSASHGLFLMNTATQTFLTGTAG